MLQGLKREREEVLQGLSQDLDSGCPKLAIIEFLGILFFNGNHNKLGLQPGMHVNLLE